MQFELPKRKTKLTYKRGLNLPGSWNTWFAWFPVLAKSCRHSPDKKVLVWLENVERKEIHRNGYGTCPEGRLEYEYRTQA